MRDLEFVWDADKNAANQRKHGIGFQEARSVFSDDRALLLADPDHSNGEDRFVLLGMSANLRMLIVCHAYRESEAAIRIISARKANRAEERQYMERQRQ